MISVKANVDKIREAIDRACQRVNREPSDVQILAACKGQDVSKIREAIDCGISLLGENRIQEAESHKQQLAEYNVSWHYVGNIQKNKVNKMLALFDLIQSVDGLKTLEHIHKRVDRDREVFIEINIGEEKSKSGFTLDGLRRALEYISRLERVRISGLLTIPPYTADPEMARPYFAQVRQFKNELNRQGIPNIRLAHLSMGMSHDYEIAVEEGATLVRIGTALFGKRAA